MVSPVWRASWHDPVKLKMHISYTLARLLISIFLRSTLIVRLRGHIYELLHSVKIKPIDMPKETI